MDAEKDCEDLEKMTKAKEIHLQQKGIKLHLLHVFLSRHVASEDLKKQATVGGKEGSKNK